MQIIKAVWARPHHRFQLSGTTQACQGRVERLVHMLSTAEASVRFAMSDTGIGIPPDKLGKVFRAVTEPEGRGRGGENHRSSDVSATSKGWLGKYYGKKLKLPASCTFAWDVFRRSCRSERQMKTGTRSGA
jgi:hypothetical protein